MRGRSLFFANFMIGGFQGRFMSVFFEEHGLTDSQIGTVLSVGALVCIVAAVVWTNKADSMARKDSKEYLLELAIILSEVTFLAQCLVDLGYVTGDLVFPYLFTLRILASCSFTAWYPLLNAIVAQDIENTSNDKKERSVRFGRERVYGAYSWLIVHMIQGILLDRYGTWIMYVGHCVSSVVALVLLKKWSREKHTSKEEKTHLASRCDLEVLSIPFKSLENMTFFMLMMVSAAGMSLVENLLFLFFTNELRASSLVCGISVVVTIIFEVPLFKFDLVGKYGVTTCITVATLCYVSRVYLYTLVPEGSYVLLVEPLHGITIAAMTLASQEYITMHAPKGKEASAQGLLTAVRSGAGTFLGTLSGGYIIEYLGEVFLYRFYGTLVLGALLLYLCAIWVKTDEGGEEDEAERPLLSNGVAAV